MCSALGQINKLNIVLKDIKPENMMIVSPFDPEYDIIPGDGMPDKLKVVLIDFGLAKQYVCSAQVCASDGSPITVCTCIY